MKPILFASMLVLPTLCFSQYTYKNLQVNFLENSTLAKNYTYGNLRLYPIYAKAGFSQTFKTVGKYLPLQEALQKGKVKITEKSASGTVENLTVENLSSDTVLIISGDVVKGGKQDRIVQQDIVLAPKSGKRDLKVFCVESARWSDRAAFQGQSKMNASAPAEFKGHFNKGSMSLRKVVEKEKDQSKVWSKVEELNTKNKTVTATKTYTAISNSSDFNKKLDAYIKFFNNRFASETNVVGVVVVTGNKVLGSDIFATPDLFKSQFSSLLHSYATEAIMNGQPVSATPAVVKAYTDNLMGDEKRQELTLKQKGSSFTDKGKKLRVSSFD